MGPCVVCGREARYIYAPALAMQIDHGTPVCSDACVRELLARWRVQRSSAQDREAHVPSRIAGELDREESE